MAENHSNAGQIYFPCGTLHPDDVVEKAIDLEGAILREAAEETGLVLSREALRAPLLIFDGPRLALVRPIRLERSADDIVSEIENYLTLTQDPELSDVLVIKSRTDIIYPAMPPFTIAYIQSAFA